MAAVANVAINLDSRGVPQKLKQVADRSKEVSVAVDRMNGNVSKSSRQFKNADVAASRASAGFGKLGEAIGKIAVAAAAFQALKFTIVKTAELETQTRSLKVLTGSLESAQNIVKQLQDIGAVTPFTSTELIDTAKRLKAFGVETDKLVDTTKRLGDLAGATGAELNGIATAYGQIQAKGKLQTEELLQLQERGIDIASTLKEEYKLTGAEFTKALEQGQISAEAVEFALKKLTDTGGKYADGAIAQSDTLAGKFSTLQDNIGRFAQSIGQVLAPALNGILDQINTLISGFNQLFEIGGVERGLRQAGALDDASRQRIYNEATKEAERLLKIGRITKDTFGQVRLNIFQESLKGLAFNEGLIKPTIRKPEAATLPPLMQGGGGGGGGRSAASVAKEQQRAAEAAKRQAEAIAEGRLESEQLLERLNMQLAIEQEINPIKKIQLQNGLEQLEIQQRYGNLIAAEGDAIRRANLERAGGLELQIANTRQTQDLVDKITEAGRAMGEFLAGQIKVTETTDQYKQLWEGISSTVANTFSSALDAAVDGTKNLGEALQGLAADLLKTIGKMLIMYGIAQALGALGGGSKNPQGVFSFLARGFGFRANGGPVAGGSPYIVGERGPELFVPSHSGTVVPNHKLNGDNINVVVNVDAKGTSVQGDDQQGNQLGRVLSAAIQQELIKQKRPGGLLA